MDEDKIEFRRLDFKLLGSDIVTFRLEDGAQVKIRVDLDNAGVAVNLKNPDGSPHYNITAGLKINVFPPNKTFYVPRSSMPSATAKDQRSIKPI